MSNDLQGDAFKTGKLEKAAVCSILEPTTAEGINLSGGLMPEATVSNKEIVRTEAASSVARQMENSKYLKGGTAE